MQLTPYLRLQIESDGELSKKVACKIWIHIEDFDQVGEEESVKITI
jgi:hypothetical protein